MLIQVFRMAATLFAIVCTVTLASAAEPTGTWLTQKGDARVRVSPCGKALCGTIVWIKDAIDPATGKPPVDESNPNPALRSRRIVGIRIFAMTKDANGVWTGGIYNSDDGKTYAGKLLTIGDTQLQVNGCAGALCGGEVWTRVGK
jgi:uncharacterized protein (DUF2147 family)